MDSKSIKKVSILEKLTNVTNVIRFSQDWIVSEGTKKRNTS